MARIDSFLKKWANTPSQFERPSDALIDRGWAGGAAEDPPEAKWENWWHNRVDEALAELESKGSLQWFDDVLYAVGATVNSGGANWIAAIANTGIEPGSVEDVGHWFELGANASEALRGVLRVGTQDEVNAGALDDVAVTPKKLLHGFAVSLAQTGYIIFPSWLGGLVFQWGSISDSATTSSITLPLPLAFPSAFWGVLTSSRSTNPDARYNAAANSTTSITLYKTSAAVNFAAFYFAFGR